MKGEEKEGLEGRGRITSWHKKQKMKRTEEGGKKSGARDGRNMKSRNERSELGFRCICLSS